MKICSLSVKLVAISLCSFISAYGADGAGSSPAKCGAKFTEKIVIHPTATFAHVPSVVVRVGQQLRENAQLAAVVAQLERDVNALRAQEITGAAVLVAARTELTEWNALLAANDMAPMLGTQPSTGTAPAATHVPAHVVTLYGSPKSATADSTTPMPIWHLLTPLTASAASQSE